MAEMGWGSDAVAALLSKLGFEYAAVVPGSSFRGLHDSLVNYLGNKEPAMLVCLHEEHAIAIAHGYAKVTGKPLLAIVHANVGLMHASMGIYDAWTDRVPMLIIGANGPGDAHVRRPWIDWIHTGRDIAAMVRAFVKWDDEPRSVEAALESIMRAYQTACTPPYAPALVILDVAMQEQPLNKPLALPDVERFGPPQLVRPAQRDVQRALEIMRNAKSPVILVGRTTRDIESWNDRIVLAETLNARVICDTKAGATFPTEHPLFVGPPSAFLTTAALDVLRSADAILNLESIDFAGMLRTAFGTNPVTATIVSCSIDRYIHNGMSMDHQALAPADLNVVVPAEQFVSVLVDELGRPAPKLLQTNGARQSHRDEPLDAPDGEMGLREFLAEMQTALSAWEVCYIRLPLGTYHGADLAFNHPLDYLGGDGGGGVGAGPGIAVGAALALRGTKRLPVAVLGDGDFLMGSNALWTAVASEIPLLIIVANNRCYYNDVVHQERIALQRKRPVERKWVAQTISDPAPDLAMLARSQGAVGIGPVSGGAAALRAALAEAIVAVQAGKTVIVDVLVAAERNAVPSGEELEAIADRFGVGTA
jgi:thiamine pyrophosphate-dependent acetolactate synthase large subunit-like protein